LFFVLIFVAVTLINKWLKLSNGYILFEPW
jgi:hypothetical protein